MCFRQSPLSQLQKHSVRKTVKFSFYVFKKINLKIDPNKLLLWMRLITINLCSGALLKILSRPMLWRHTFLIQMYIMENMACYHLWQNKWKSMNIWLHCHKTNYKAYWSCNFLISTSVTFGASIIHAEE